MKVLKFGGTSVGSAESIRNVKEIINTQPGSKIVVLSAMSGVTNELVNLVEYFKLGSRSSQDEIMERLHQKHKNVIGELFSDSEVKKDTLAQIEQMFGQLQEVISRKYDVELEPVVLTYGESFLTCIFSKYLEAEEINNTLLDAKDFMHVQSLENPNIDVVSDRLEETLKREIRSEIYITQGFVRIDRFRNINTLKRGGSDYSATIIAAACGAKEVQIWTDIDGFHNNDPRYVENTTALSHLTFEEAAELAYFGAKILHPQTVQPVKDRNIPIYLKNTFTPKAAGTKISSEVKSTGLKAISAKDGITAIKIKSNRMLMAHGFLRKIFDVFDKHQTAIDMITTSEIAISLTIDDIRNLDLILNELEAYGEITVEKEHSIICIVGESVIEDKGIYRIFELLNDIPVRMISYGGSKNNISLLVDTRNKIEILKSLNEKLFSKREQTVL
jgi:aspartate kinase